MYNKHTRLKTEYQLIIDNKFGIAFNTEQKRQQAIRKLNGTRIITCVSDVSYPWEPNWK